MKKLLACLVLLSTVLSSDVFCGKKKRQQKQNTETIDNSVEAIHDLVINEIDYWKQNHENFIAKDKDLSNQLEKFKIEPETFTNDTFTNAFTEKTLTAITVCLLSSTTNNTILFSTFLNDIRTKIAPTVIQRLHEKFKKTEKLLSGIFEMELEKLLKSSTIRKKEIIQSISLGEAITNVIRLCASYVGKTIILCSSEQKNIQKTLKQPIPDTDSSEEEGEEEGEYGSSEEESLDETPTKDAELLEIEARFKKNMQETQQEIQKETRAYFENLRRNIFKDIK